MGKPFRFTLQAILDHHARLEQEKLIELVLAQRALDEATSEAAGLCDNFQVSANILGTQASSHSVDLPTHYAHLEYLVGAIRRRRETVSLREANLENTRLEMLGAVRKRQVLEKLKKRRAHDHAVLCGIAEQREIDECNACAAGPARMVGRGRAL